MKHDLYKPGDADAPDQIRDRNGYVVLEQCRICGRGEQELIDTPDCPGRERASPMSDTHAYYTAEGRGAVTVTPDGTPPSEGRYGVVVRVTSSGAALEADLSAEAAERLRDWLLAHYPINPS